MEAPRNYCKNLLLTLILIIGVLGCENKDSVVLEEDPSIRQEQSKTEIVDDLRSAPLSNLEKARAARKKEMNLWTEYKKMQREYPPVIFTGKVTRLDDDGAHWFGQVLPTTSFSKEGDAPVGPRVNSYIAGYDKDLVKGSEYRGNYRGYYYFDQTLPGTNALGGAINVYAYRPIPQKMYDIRERITEQTQLYVNARAAYAREVIPSSAVPTNEKQGREALEPFVDALYDLANFNGVTVGETAIPLADMDARKISLTSEEDQYLPSRGGNGAQTVWGFNLGQTGSSNNKKYIFVFENEGVIINTDSSKVLSISYILEPEVVFGYSPELHEVVGNLKPSEVSLDKQAPLFSPVSVVLLGDMTTRAHFDYSNMFWEITELDLRLKELRDQSKLYLPEAQLNLIYGIQKEWSHFHSQQFPGPPQQRRFGSEKAPWVGRVERIWREADGKYRLVLAMPLTDNTYLDALYLDIPAECRDAAINPLEDESIRTLKSGDLVHFNVTTGWGNCTSEQYDIRLRADPYRRSRVTAIPVLISNPTKIEGLGPSDIVFETAPTKESVHCILTLRFSGETFQSQVLAITILGEHNETFPLSIRNWEWDPVLDMLAHTDNLVE